MVKTSLRRKDVARLQERHYRKNPSRGESDSVAAHELALFIINDGELYRSQTQPIILNLRRKLKRGVYDSEKAVKLYKYLADNGAKKYTFEHDAYLEGGRYAHHAPHWRELKGYGIFTVATRLEAACELRDYYDEQVNAVKTRFVREGMAKNPHIRRNPQVRRRLFVLALKTPQGWRELQVRYRTLATAKKTAHALARSTHVPVRITAGAGSI